MKQTAFAAIFALTVVSSVVGADRGLSFAVGLSPQTGIAYAAGLDPGLSGLALEAMGQISLDGLVAELGVESGTSPLGWQMLFPLRAGLRWGESAFHATAALEVSPGLSLTRPALFMLGLGGAARIDWRLAPRFGLYAGIGLRITLCPAYRNFTGIAYQSLDIPLALGVRWQLSP